MISAAAQSTSDPNAYLIALIAVLGTIVGAGISGVVQFLTNNRLSSSQQSLIQLQLERSATEALRQDRRRVYARFLTSMDKWNRLYLDVYKAKSTDREVPNFDKEQREFALASSELDLVAGTDIAYIAHRIFNRYLRSMTRASNGLHPDVGHREGMAFPTALLAAMHKELGVEGPPARNLK